MQVKAQVIAAWKAEQKAFARAVLQANPQFSGLAKTAIDPELSGIRAVVAAEKKAGYVGKRLPEDDLGQPVVVKLSPLTDPVTAIVESCVHDGLIFVHPKTGKPVAGPSGRPTWDFNHTTLKHVAGVGWMVASNDVRAGSKKSVCAGH
jgi:hypothetical protein